MCVCVCVSVTLALSLSLALYYMCVYMCVFAMFTLYVYMCECVCVYVYVCVCVCVCKVLVYSNLILRNLWRASFLLLMCMYVVNACNIALCFDFFVICLFLCCSSGQWEGSALTKIALAFLCLWLIAFCSVELSCISSQVDSHRIASTVIRLYCHVQQIQWKKIVPFMMPSMPMKDAAMQPTLMLQVRVESIEGRTLTRRQQPRRRSLSRMARKKLAPRLWV